MSISIGMDCQHKGICVHYIGCHHVARFGPKARRAGFGSGHRGLKGMVLSSSVDEAATGDASMDSVNIAYGYMKKATKGGVIVEMLSESDNVEGFLPWQEAPLSINKKVKKHETMKELMPLGLKREFSISEINGENAEEGEEHRGIVLSARDIDKEMLWKRMEQIFSQCTYEKENFSVVINGANKGGLTAYIAGYPVFIPISQLQKREDGKMWDVQSLQTFYMKKRIRIALLEVNADDRRVVCSELRAIENDLIRKLEVGRIVQGRIRKVENFGVFVGIQGTRMSALLHVSNISRDHVDHPEDVLTQGEQISAMIIGMNEDYSNISLSTAVLEETDGDMLRDKKILYSNAEERAAKFMEESK